VKAEIEKLIEQLSLLTTCAAKLVETLVNLKEVELAERQNDAGKERPPMGFSAHQIKAEEASLAIEKPAEKTPEIIRNLMNYPDFAKMVGKHVTSLYSMVNRGKLPSERGEDGVLRIDLDACKGSINGPDDLYKPFDVWVGSWRSTDDKARGIAIRRVMEIQDELPRDFVLGVKEHAIRARFDNAIADGIIQTYKLGGVDFINVDELKTFALWYVENYHRPNKSQYKGHDSAYSKFCIHENDLVWTQTRNFYDRIAADQKRLTENFGKFRKQSVQVRGVRYYTTDVLTMI
jgi:hypothetical protein